jgi:tetratricopeptide (TPR) repeat protein
MSKYKVCVYAISKNEEKFVDRWYKSMKEADEIYVLDTGSTDNTIKLLKEKGVYVKRKIIKPWRFDVARNESLKLVPKDVDICVCTDLDEVFETGWRKELENIWEKNTNRCQYTYNWSLDKDNNPLVTFYYEKIHSRDNYEWVNPVHEILKFNGNFENIVVNSNIILNHYPDSTKSRSSYLPLLELSVKENPYNDRNMHYLGREYMYYGKYNEAIDTLIKHLHLESATWKDERCASMRFIARCYKFLKRYDEANMWLLKAIDEAPYLRDPYIEMALLKYELNDFNEVYKYINLALKIKEHQKTYINEVFSWNETPYDLLSIACYYLDKYDEALEAVNHALEFAPYDERLLKNKELIIDKINEKEIKCNL